MGRDEPEVLERAATGMQSGTTGRCLPGDRILRLRGVLDRTGLSRSTLYRKVSEGTFPRSVAISARCVGWRESEIEAWLAEPFATPAGRN